MYLLKGNISCRNIGSRMFISFFVPSHQLSMCPVSEQALEAWYYREIPHNLSG
jgi:hypothetical protein